MAELFFNGPLSRLELSELTGLSPATASNVTAELFSERLIVEAGQVDSDGGRPRVLLRVDPKFGQVIGVTVAEDGIEVTLFDLAMNKLAESSDPPPSGALDPVAVADLIALRVHQVISEAGVDPSGVIGIGIAVPGVVEQGLAGERPIDDPEAAQAESKRPDSWEKFASFEKSRSVGGPDSFGYSDSPGKPGPVGDAGQVSSASSVGSAGPVGSAGSFGDPGSVENAGSLEYPGTFETLGSRPQTGVRERVHAPTIGWQGISLSRMLQDRGVAQPMFIENGAKTLGQAEMWFGAGRGSQHTVVVLIGTGVGAAIFTEGTPYQGVSSSAGEWGHTTIAYNGRQCRCGARGCLEAYIGAEGILDRYRSASDSNSVGDVDGGPSGKGLPSTDDLSRDSLGSNAPRDDLAGNIVNGKSPSKDDFGVVDLAEDGVASAGFGEAIVGGAEELTDADDFSRITAMIRAAARSKVASDLLDETADLVGIGIANLINLYNPERVLVTGWTGLALGPRILPRVRESVRKSALPHLFAQVSIDLGILDPRAGTLGAATLPLAALLTAAADPRIDRKPAVRSEAAGSEVA